MLEFTLLLLSFLSTAPSASPREVDFSQAAVVEIRLSNFDFTPNTIHLRAGQPVILRLSNTASGGHDFGASAFFAAAAVRPSDAGMIRNGRVEVRPRQSVDIALVPGPGAFRLRCDHPLHSTLGMNGEITVD